MSDAATAATAAIEIANLGKRYGRTVALDSVSFDVKPGEMFALLGPNGAGKTTLIHILCTILGPDSGAARIAGLDVVAQSQQARRCIGVVFQEPSLDDRLTVHENLDFHGMVYGVPADLRRRRIDEVLALVELTDWRAKLARMLSAGMKRRLEIARALVHDSRILILDEPTAGLDPQSRERIWTYLRRLQADRHMTVIVTTHYLEEVETCDRLCVIDRGKIMAVATPGALKAEHGRELLRVTPRDSAASQLIAARYPGAVVRGDGEIVLTPDRPDFVEKFLAAFGGAIRGMSLDKPTLESVFLSLTGRDLRDQAAGARERTFAFGQRGGEHTR